MELAPLGRAHLVDKARNLWREAFGFEIKVVEGENRVRRFTASTEDVDRDGDVIEVGGWQLGPYRKNPVVLWAHQTGGMFSSPMPPIGMASKVRVKDGRLVIDVRFAKAEDFPFAETILRLVDDGIIRAGSVGFIPRASEEREDKKGGPVGRRFTKQELIEFSIVPVPSNPNALHEAEERGLIDAAVRKQIENHAALFRAAATIPAEALEPERETGLVSHRSYALIDRDRPWSGQGARRRLLEWAGGKIDGDDAKRKFARGFAWFDAAAADTPGAYKYPHHDIDDGEIKTHWRGVVAAMTALLGGQGGAEIPEEEKRAIYDHLAKHYREFEEQPPEFRHYGLQDQIGVLKDGGYRDSEAVLFLAALYRPGREGELADDPATRGDLERVDRRVRSIEDALLVRMDKLSDRMLLTDDAIDCLTDAIRSGTIETIANGGPAEEGKANGSAESARTDLQLLRTQIALERDR